MGRVAERRLDESSNGCQHSTDLLCSAREPESLECHYTFLGPAEADFQEAGEDFVEDSDYRENQQTRLPPESYSRACATTGQI